MGRQVLGHGGHEGLRAGRRGAADAGDANGGGDGPGEDVDLPGLHRQAMIGTAAGDRRGGLGHVETAEAIRVGVETAARRERAGVLHAKAFSAARKSASSESTTSALVKS